MAVSHRKEWRQLPVVVPWQREESLLTTAKSLEQAEIDLRKQEEETSLEEIKRKEAEEGNGFASLSPRKNHLGGQRQPLKDWLPAKEKEHLTLMKGKQGKLSMFNFWDDAPLKGWVPGKALAEASSSSKMASGSSKTPNSTSWTPGSPWIPGKALAEAAQSHDQPGKEKTRT